MSHSQFQSKGFILRLAWLSLWDERMTTGRINQVTPQTTYNHRFHALLLHKRQSFSLELQCCQKHITMTCRDGRSSCALLIFAAVPLEHLSNPVPPPKSQQWWGQVCERCHQTGHFRQVPGNIPHKCPTSLSQWQVCWSFCTDCPFLAPFPTGHSALPFVKLLRRANQCATTFPIPHQHAPSEGQGLVWIPHSTRKRVEHLCSGLQKENGLRTGILHTVQACFLSLQTISSWFWFSWGALPIKSSPVSVVEHSYCCVNCLTLDLYRQVEAQWPLAFSTSNRRTLSLSSAWIRHKPTAWCNLPLHHGELPWNCCVSQARANPVVRPDSEELTTGMPNWRRANRASLTCSHTSSHCEY